MESQSVLHRYAFSFNKDFVVDLFEKGRSFFMNDVKVQDLHILLLDKTST